MKETKLFCNLCRDLISKSAVDTIGKIVAGSGFGVFWESDNKLILRNDIMHCEHHICQSCAVQISEELKSL